jgi:hypothetical protein
MAITTYVNYYCFAEWNYEKYGGLKLWTRKAENYPRIIFEELIK